jgi:hypothetical protein
MTPVSICLSIDQVLTPSQVGYDVRKRQTSYFLHAARRAEGAARMDKSAFSVGKPVTGVMERGTPLAS